MKFTFKMRRKVMELAERFKSAAEVLKRAKALIVTAGAGIGVDSGLPDFRGDKGFWNAYPMYERLGINFVEAANPIHFAMDPAFTAPTSIATLPLMPVFRFYWTGPRAITWTILSPHPMWTGTSSGPASLKTGFTRSTARSFTCSA